MTDETDETDEKTEFTFDELDERAKEKARDALRDVNVDHGWWAYVYEDAAECARRLGIEMNYCNKTPDIWFSGFCSQGDGCCFSGSLHVERMNGAAKKIAEHAPKDKELAELAVIAQRIYDSVQREFIKARLLGEELEYDPRSMSLPVTGNHRSFNATVSGPGNNEEEEFFGIIEDDCNDLVSYFADWIYRQLEIEYEHLTSDEAIEDAIRGNEYTFDEDGRLL